MRYPKTTPLVTGVGFPDGRGRLYLSYGISGSPRTPPDDGRFRDFRETREPWKARHVVEVIRKQK